MQNLKQKINVFLIVSVSGTFLIWEIDIHNLLKSVSTLILRDNQTNPNICEKIKMVPSWIYSTHDRHCAFHQNLLNECVSWLPNVYLFEGDTNSQRHLTVSHVCCLTRVQRRFILRGRCTRTHAMSKTTNSWWPCPPVTRFNRPCRLLPLLHVKAFHVKSIE